MINSFKNHILFTISILALLANCKEAYIPKKVSSNEIIKNVVASSSLSDKFNASNLIDHKSTSWCAGGSNAGIDETIQIDLKEKITLNKIYISNGFGTPKFFKSNNRVKEIEISDNENSKRVISLNDTHDTQSYDFDKLTTEKITLKILSVYKGSLYNDTCIHEISFDEIPGFSTASLSRNSKLTVNLLKGDYSYLSEENDFPADSDIENKQAYIGSAAEIQFTHNEFRFRDQPTSSNLFGGTYIINDDQIQIRYKNIWPGQDGGGEVDIEKNPYYKASLEVVYLSEYFLCIKTNKPAVLESTDSANSDGYWDESKKHCFIRSKYKDN